MLKRRKGSKNRTLGMFGILNRLAAYEDARRGRSPNRLSAAKDVDRKALWRLRRVNTDKDE
jgi:hypothetical protein